jgi:D-alanyl-lipoteichoic acid acyltransferase DltB (MBOAT superfamily)
MLFNTAQFVLFFALVLVVHRALPLQRRNAWLLGCSLVFYFLWIPAYLLLLLVDIGVNFALLRGMVRSSRSRLFLIASIVFTLGLLVFFKYAVFLVESFTPLTQGLLGYTPPLPEVVLPLGISFYSFQILALQIDVQRGRIDPPGGLARYALFVAFFPQLIAGPILRGHEFLPQLERGGRVEPERTRRGLWLIASGVVKKVILGDYLLAPFVNDVYGNAGVAEAPVQLLATYSFAFQIYFDFSGYTDMARGMACLLGFDLPLNFREPYLSRNPAEFWRCWHTTLSRWLRDYLYIPLGGNRAGALRTYANLLVTMLLGGLWHGAGWNFVLWGGLHVPGRRRAARLPALPCRVSALGLLSRAPLRRRAADSRADLQRELPRRLAHPADAGGGALRRPPGAGADRAAAPAEHPRGTGRRSLRRRPRGTGAGRHRRPRHRDQRRGSRVHLLSVLRQEPDRAGPPTFSPPGPAGARAA